MKKIVLSGVNMVEGGILTIFRTLIKILSSDSDIKIICLVNKKELFESEMLNDNIEFIEFPDVKRSWLKRIKFEFIDSYFISRRLKADLWICLHDITANLYRTKQMVYCHNPSPFYKVTKKDFTFDKKFFLFTIFYKLLYRINIKKNDTIFVQQEWIADNFRQWFGISNVLVSRPQNEKVASNAEARDCNYNPFENKVIFFYPSFPRTFKNFEVIIKSLKLLKEKNINAYNKVVILLTIDDDMNKYSKHICDEIRDAGISNIKLLGKLDITAVHKIYRGSCDYLLFPSKLETWGLPLTEAKSYEIPIIVSDLPYAHETIGNYKKCKFFDPENYYSLSNVFEEIINKNITYDTNHQNTISPLCELNDWEQFKSYIIKSISTQV
ncbi:glycosyltransferase [Tatumella punctata]|uniref:Glycosyltransferase n=1 Tax=Tatumella punctata TaxID=399969 RepID=A0ABW1VTA2_9GAMM